MADTQPGSEEVAAKEVPATRFWRSLIAVFKENREVLPNFPEMIESLIENEEHIANLTEAHKLEEYRTSVEAVIKQLKDVENENTALKTELQKKKKKKEVAESEEKTSVEEVLMTKDKEMEAVIKQLKDVGNENMALKTELEKKKTEVTESEEKLSSKESEMKNMFDKYCKALDKHKSRIVAQEDKIKHYSQSMSQAKDELKAAYTKTEGYKSRLASLSDKRVKQDQRFVEDTLGSNRQSELENDFSAFFDDDRMDACEKMQSIYHNKEDDFIYIFYPRLACIIFETAYEQAKEVNEAASYLFKEFTKIMIDYAAKMGTDLCVLRKLYTQGKYGYETCSFPISVALWGERSDYPKEVMDGMTLSLKEAAHICNLDSLVQEVSNITHFKWNNWYEEDTTCMFSPAWHLIEGLDKYIKASIRLTWRMVTQVPPMKLEYHCSKIKKDLHRNVSKVCTGTHSSAQPDQEEEIACYLWPGLQDGGGRRIRPGEVLCKVTKK